MNDELDLQECFRSLQRIRYDYEKGSCESLQPKNTGCIFVTQMDIDSRETQGDKPPVTYMVRYWLGSKDHTYIELVGSDGSTYWDKSNTDPMEDFYVRLGMIHDGA